MSYIKFNLVEHGKGNMKKSYGWNLHHSKEKTLRFDAQANKHLIFDYIVYTILFKHINRIIA